MDILTYHKVSMVDFLEDELLKHHVLFAKLYADCVKFKPHWQLHVPTAVRRSGKILTCFAGEKKGKFSKNIASHCFNKSSCTVTSYCLRDCIETLENPDLYRP